MKSLSQQFASSIACDFSLQPHGSSCHKCNNIVSSMQEENITAKYFQKGTLVYYIDCNHKYSDASFLNIRRYIFPDIPMTPEGEKVGITKFMSLPSDLLGEAVIEVEPNSNTWEDEDYVDVPANVWPEEASSNTSEEEYFADVPGNLWQGEEIYNDVSAYSGDNETYNDVANEWPEEGSDDTANPNEIDWNKNLIQAYSEDDIIVECPLNLMCVTQSFFPNSVLNTLLIENTKVKLKTYIKIYTIYRFWYRVLKYISRGYTIFGIFDILKNIIETDDFDKIDV